jgi:hypothetical protein
LIGTLLGGVFGGNENKVVEELARTLQRPPNSSCSEGLETRTTLSSKIQ